MNKEKKWKKTREEGYVTFMQCDVKNQYTNLCIKDLRESVKKVFEVLSSEGKSGIAITRQKIYKSEDGFEEKKKFNKRFWWVSFVEVLEFIEYELRNCFVKVGKKKIVIQVEGIPMGGKVSVQLANLDMMRKKVEGKK